MNSIPSLCQGEKIVILIDCSPKSLLARDFLASIFKTRTEGIYDTAVNCKSSSHRSDEERMMGLAIEALLSQSVLFSPPEARSATCRDGKSEEDEDGSDDDCHYCVYD